LGFKSVNMTLDMHRIYTLMIPYLDLKYNKSSP